MSSTKRTITRTPSHFLYSVPFIKAAETADDDLFPPIRPPAEEGVVLQSNDSARGEEDADNAEAEAEAATEDGSEEADESDEVCSSFPHKKKNGLATNDIGHRIYHGTRKPEP